MRVEAIATNGTRSYGRSKTSRCSTAAPPARRPAPTHGRHGDAPPCSLPARLRRRSESNPPTKVEDRADRLSHTLVTSPIIGPVVLNHGVLAATPEAFHLHVVFNF